MSDVKKPNGSSGNIPAKDIKGPKNVQATGTNKLVKSAAEIVPTLTNPMVAALSFLGLQSPKLKQLVKEKKISPDTAKKATAKVKDILAEDAFGIRSIDKGSIA